MLASTALSQLRRKASLPDSQDLFSDSDLIGFFNDENLSVVTPWLNQQREEFFTTYKDFTVTSGTQFYSLPSRAFQGKIRDVQVIENGNTRSLNRYWEEDRGTLGSEGFFVVGNKIELTPTPVRSFTLRVLFDRRPSTLVPVLDTARIASIDTNNSQVTVESAPSTFLTGVLVDLISSDSPHAADDDVTITAISGLTITLSSMPSNLQVGDYVQIAGQTPLIQLPIELANVLVQAVTIKIYESLQKYDAMKAATEMMGVQMRGLGDALNPRVAGESKKVYARIKRW